jgi:fibronectin-binding autotransporter adhesin
VTLRFSFVGLTSILSLGMALPLPLSAQTAVANNQLPTGGQVSAGQASISQTAKTLTVNQTSQRAVVDWNTFNVGSQAQVHFQQPNAQSATLNRVADNNPSQILGRITAPGQVVLINPQGVYFGKTATVDVGGLVATTHNAANQAFMEGRMKFDRQGASGKVVNEGELRAALNGYIALLAPEVRNSGVILANLGTVALAAGEAFELQFETGGGLTGLRVTAASINTLVENQSAIKAPGGLIILSAQAVAKLRSGVVNNGGTLEANGLSRKGGRIILEASTRVRNSGTVQANATPSQAGVVGGPAGTVLVQAPEVVNTGVISATSVVAPAASLVVAEVAPVLAQIEIKTEQFSQTSSGVLDVSAVGGAAGRVSVQASQTAQVAGQVLAVAQESSEPALYIEQGVSAAAALGGLIDLAPAQQVQTSGAVLDASGANRAGRIHVQSKGLPADPTAPSQPAPSKLILSNSVLRANSSRGLGGRVELESDELSLESGTLIDAKGATGGGTVWVGGGWQGSGPLHQATSVYFSADSQIDASATDKGDGGEVVLWSDVHKAGSVTTANGSIWAKGGVNGGNGGRVETSGHELRLGDQVAVSTKAFMGQDGEWLLDPENLYIKDTSWAGSNYSGSGTTTYTALTPDTNAPILASDSNSVDTRGAAYANGVSVVRADTIINALASGNLKIIATGWIAMNTWNNRPVYQSTAYVNTTSSNKLTFQAGDYISIGSAQIYMPNGTLELLAGTSITQDSAAPLYANTLILNSSNIGTNTPSVNLSTANNYITNLQASNIASLSLTNAQALTVNSNGLSATGDVSLNVTSLSGSGNISLASGKSLTVTQSGNSTYAGVVSGSGASFVKAGAGALYLTGVHTYDAGTTISAGYLELNTTGRITGNVVNNGQLGFNQNADVTLAGSISGTGSVVKYASNTLTLSGTSTYRGATTVANGTLKVTGKIYCYVSACNTDQNPAAVITIRSGAVFELTDWGFWGSLGTNYFDNTNIIIDGGTLRYAGSASTSSARAYTVTSNGATFENASSGTTWGFDYDAYSLYKPILNGHVKFTGAGDFGISQMLSGAVNLTKEGAGTLTFYKANSYTGTTTINGGVLKFASTGSIYSSADITTNVNVNSGGVLDIYNWGWYGSLGGFRFDPGNLVINGGTIRYSGLTGGTWRSFTAGNLGATFDNPNAGVTWSMDNSAQAPVISGNITFTGAGNTVMSHTLTGSAYSIIKTGAGTLTLGGNNTYTGATTINDGTLVVENNAPTFTTSGYSGAGSLVVQSAGTTFTSPVVFDKAISGLAGLTIGKTTNTANVSALYSLSASGPVRIYGGNVFLADNLTSTAGGQLLLQGTGDVTLMGNVSTSGAFSATAGAASSFLMGMNYATTVGSTITANGGVTLTAGTNYLAGNITTVGTGISVTGNVQLANLSATPDANPVTFDSGGGAITLTGGTVSGFSGTVADYALVGLNKSKSATGSAAAVSTISLSGTSYLLYQFTALGADTFYTPNGVSSVDYLVVAGGGGGGEGLSGTYSGGGGGGGGVANGTFSLSSASIRISVGDGGGWRTQGTDSSFGNILAGAGGFGGRYHVDAGSVGTGGAGYAAGGGGGGAGNLISSGSAGGTGSQRTGGTGGGNGGLGWGGSGGGAGGNAVTGSGNGGTPGAGVASSITGTSVTYGSGGAATGSAAPANSGQGGNSSYYGTTKAGSGVVILRHTLTNGTRAAGTTLKVLSGAGALSFASNASNLSNLTIDASSSNNFAGALMGSTGLTKLGSGTLSLTNTNTHSGITYINSGTLQVGNGGATGSLGYGDVVNNTGLVFNSSGNSVAIGVISGPGALTKLGSGTVALTNANTYTGNTTLSGGTLGIYHNASINSGALTAADGTTLYVWPWLSPTLPTTSR